MPIVFRSFLHDRILHLLVVTGAILLFLVDFSWPDLPKAVDWHTMMTLTSLLILTKGLETSGYFDVLGGKLIARFRHERALALFMVLAAALLSTFLTNDVALFILVPLTLTLRKFSRLPISRLIIFEALAVNAGSLITPVGNPQNILLWSHGSLSVAGFIWQMLPLAVWLMLTLMSLTWWCFSRREIHKHGNSETLHWQKPLFIVSVLLYVLFIMALEWHLTGWALLAIVLCFLVLARPVLLNIDWSLLAVFIYRSNHSALPAKANYRCAVDRRQPVPARIQLTLIVHQSPVSCVTTNIRREYAPLPVRAEPAFLSLYAGDQTHAQTGRHVPSVPALERTEPAGGKLAPAYLTDAESETEFHCNASHRAISDIASVMS